MKTCTECKLEFPATLDYFHKMGNYLRNICKSCHNAYNRKYKNLNKPRINGYDRKRRALKLKNGHEEYTEDQVLQAYGTNCNICSFSIDLDAPRKVGLPGWENGLHFDHVIELTNGGPDMLNNIRPTHGLCNLKKNGKNKWINI